MNKPFQKMMFAPLQEEAPNIYMTPAWQQHEDLVAHLSQFSQNVLLIIAPQGGGKTTFMQHFVNKPTQALHKKIITAKAQTTTRELIHQVLKVFDLKIDDSLAIKPYLQAAIEEDYELNHATWTLFVDDAHLLSNEQLQSLIQLVNFDLASHQQLRLVLLGEPSLELRLFSPEFTAIAHGKLYTIELEPWSFQDVQALLVKEGFSPHANKDQIASIFERSRGLPGYVMREKNATFGNIKKAGTKMKKRNFTLWGFHPISLGVLAGLIMGGGYLILNSNLDEEGSTTVPVNAAQLTEDNWPKNEISPQKSSPSVAYHFDKVDTSDVVEDDMKLENAEKMVPLTSNAPTPLQDKPQPVMPAKVATEAVQEDLQALPVVKDDVVAPKTLMQQVAKKEEKSNKTDAKKSLGSEETHLLAVNKNHFTLQLLGASKEENVKAFIAKHGIADKTHYFRMKRSGKDWFVVVYGDYSSQDAARAAVKSMPASLKNANLQPWVREINSVHEDIRQSQKG